MQNNHIAVYAGIFLGLMVSIFILLPTALADTFFLIQKDGSTPVQSCTESNGFVLAQNLTDLCDVVIITPLTNQVVAYNGSFWVNANISSDNTICANVGTGAQVYKDGECNFRTLIGSSDISIVQNLNEIVIDFNGTAGGDTTTCVNIGTGTGYSCVEGTNINLRSLLSGGSGLTITNNTNTITITNTLPEVTACNNVGTGNQLCSGGNVNIDTLIAGTGITITDTTDDWTFASQCANTGSGEAICESSNNINSLIAGTGVTIVDTTGDLTVTNSGVISNSCSGGITCSGTNPSTFTVAWELLCSNSGTGASVSCGAFTARKYLHFEIIYVSGSGGTALQPAYQFNSDTGTNYAWRDSNNGAADTTATSTSSCTVRGALTIASDEGGIVVGDIMNIATLRKDIIAQNTLGISTGATVAPTKNENACKWSNTTDQITTITLIKTAGTNNYTTGTQIVVWGHD